MQHAGAVFQRRLSLEGEQVGQDVVDGAGEHLRDRVHFGAGLGQRQVLGQLDAELVSE